MRNQITIHTMVRNEAPQIWYALMSTLPFVENAIVIDTGSTDGTWELLEDIKKRFPFVRLYSMPSQDSTGFGESNYNSFPLNWELTTVRNKMIWETETKWLWIQDGDEIYTKKAAQNILDTIGSVPESIQAIFVPILWFAKDFKHIENSFAPNRTVYPHTGRIFVKKDFEIRGAVPGEMGYYVGVSEPYTLGMPRTYTVPYSEEIAYYHYEMICKPWRRRVRNLIEFKGAQPEVFFGERAPEREGANA